MNDLFKAFSKLTPIIFGDDTNELIFARKNIDTLFQSMNKELEKVAVWLKANEDNFSH